MSAQSRSTLPVHITWNGKPLEAIAQALLAATAADARGLFTHCGYPTPIQAEPPSCSEMEELIAQSR